MNIINNISEITDLSTIPPTKFKSNAAITQIASPEVAVVTKYIYVKQNCSCCNCGLKNLCKTLFCGCNKKCLCNNNKNLCCLNEYKHIYNYINCDVKFDCCNNCNRGCCNNQNCCNCK